MSQKFRVQVRGKNFYLETIAGPQIQGFLVNCFLEASDEKQAKMEAERLVLSAPELTEIMLDEQPGSPSISFEEIGECGTLPERWNGNGFYFFSEPDNQE